MHQIRKKLSHSNLHCYHIQGNVLQSIAKAIHQSPSPIHFHNVKSHAGIVGNNYADALARKSITTYSDVADTSIKTAGPEEGIPSTAFTGLQKNMENIRDFTTSTKHPVTYLKALVPIQLP